MNKATVLKEIEACGVVAVIRADSGDEALGAVRALLRGGVRAIEITFTVPDAARTIERLARAAEAGDLEGELLLGAGTVLTPEQVNTAVAAGAQYLVSPCVAP